MNIFRWLKKRKNEEKVVYQSASKNENDVCPECGGQGYNYEP